MRGRSFKDYFGRDRKALYIVLGIVMALVFTLTVVYAALSTTLNINGNAEVTAASWDIYLDNVQLNSQSATTTVPKIIDKTTVSFSTILSKPGDFYLFTIDIVNDGSIDAMIDSVTKTPELSASQAKYLNYIIEYQNGESINTKQLVSKKSFVRLNVKVEFRKDITASDLPTTSETLNLSFKVNYVQSDNNSENINIDNSGKIIKIVNGDYDTIGSEICVGEECFYVISSDDDSVTMLAKYNLYVKGTYNGTLTKYGNEATGKQNSTMVGKTVDAVYPYNGVTSFGSNYWTYDSSDKYVFNEKSAIYQYVIAYEKILEGLSTINIDVRLIKKQELMSLGCVYNTYPYSCSKSSYPWVYTTSYWTGSAASVNQIYYVTAGGVAGVNNSGTGVYWGVRPVITILKSDF